MASADIFNSIQKPVPKNTLHIYHSGRIHFKVLITKRSLNARLNNKNAVKIPEPPAPNANNIDKGVKQPITNIRNGFNIGLDKSVTQFKNIETPMTTTLTTTSPAETPYNPFNENIAPTATDKTNPFNKF